MEATRNRAWRRFKSRTKGNGRSDKSIQNWSVEKNWKLLYGRSIKQYRARQLGMTYPLRTVRQVLDDEQPLE